MSSSSDTKIIRVHADTLEYTRQGLRTREPLPLAVGANNRVVLVRPRKIRSIAASHGGFPPDASLPLPATLSLALYAHAGNIDAPFSADRPKDGVYQVFAHAGPSGSDDHNKALTDRRAKAMVALLQADVDAMLAIANEEGWDLEFQQTMLRVLEADPGPIDGRVGPLTEQAVRDFQTRYAQGEFHAPQDGSPKHADLEVTGKIDARTSEALIEAYVLAHSPHLETRVLHPTHPHNGCAAFNLASPDAPEANRRVSLVVYEDLPPHHENTPCVEGDAAACPILGDSSVRCSWYRLHVEDAPLEKVQHHHFRLSWLPLADGRYLLSALTTVPDAEEVTFEVFASKRPVDGEGPMDASLVLDSLGTQMSVKPKHGVAQVFWDPPEGFSPGKDGRIAFGADRAVPIFRVEHPKSGTIAHDSWPADEVAVLFARSSIDQDFAPNEATEIELTCPEQGLQLAKPASEAVPFDETHYILRFEGIEPRGRFSLTARYANGAQRPIFEEVAYDELGDYGPPDEPLPALAAEASPERDASEDLDAAGGEPPDEFPVLDFGERRTIEGLL